MDPKLSLCTKREGQQCHENLLPDRKMTSEETASKAKYVNNHVPRNIDKIPPKISGGPVVLANLRI